jgi:hypothetical protein
MTVGRHVIPRRLGHLLYAAAFVLIVGCGFSASAQQPADELVPAKLNCGSHSANSNELKPFQFDLQFEVFGSLWMVDRTTSPQPGMEKFRGILSPSGTMLVAGEGKLEDGTAWTYEFSGRKNPKGVTILRGTLRSDKPKGARTCSLTF